MSAEADEVINIAQVVDAFAADTVGREFTRDTSYAQRASAVAAMTSDDDETEDDVADVPSPEVVRQSALAYLADLSFHETEVLLILCGYQRLWSIVSTQTAYLQAQNSYQNKELYNSFGAICKPEGKFWTILLGKGPPPGIRRRLAYRRR